MQVLGMLLVDPGPLRSVLEYSSLDRALLDKETKSHQTSASTSASVSVSVPAAGAGGADEHKQNDAEAAAGAAAAEVAANPKLAAMAADRANVPRKWFGGIFIAPFIVILHMNWHPFVCSQCATVFGITATVDCLCHLGRRLFHFGSHRRSHHRRRRHGHGSVSCAICNKLSFSCVFFRSESSLFFFTAQI